MKRRGEEGEQSAQQIVDSNQESKEKLEKPSGPQPAEVYDKFSDFKI